MTIKSCRELIIFFLISAVFVMFFQGCEEQVRNEEEDRITEELPDKTIGEIAEYVQFGQTPLIGFGIVAGLNGTGSSEIPPQLTRSQLTKYILQNVPERGVVNPQEFLNSKNTAIVQVHATMPAVPTRKQAFDVYVKAFSQTQTTSLEGGRLYTAELKERARLERFDQYTKTLATASGPVFINYLSNSKPNVLSGTILGGGEVVEEMPVSLLLNEPSFLIASAVRNRIDERFGPRTAVAMSVGQIRINIPLEYVNQKARFMALVNSLNLLPGSEERQGRIQKYVNNLRNKRDMASSEIILEAIGKSALPAIAPLLTDSDPIVRFYAARCMLNLDDIRGLFVLRDIARDQSNSNVSTSSSERIDLRVAAVKAMGEGARKNDVVSILNSFLSESDFKLRFAAYRQLRYMDDLTIRTHIIADEFLVDTVACSGPKVIYASTSKVPKIVLFNAPINCEDNMFIVSDDNEITLNSKAGDNFISVMRKHPSRPRLIGPIKSSRRLLDIISTLCEDPVVSDEEAVEPGLGIHYSKLLPVLKKMSEKKAVLAEFAAEK